MRRLAQEWRLEGHSIGLVPTMGALHSGHMSLVERARAENARVVASIFVNPLQFDPSEDLASYPRHPAADLALLAGAGTDAAYLPAAAEMYRPGATTRVRVHVLDEVLEGLHRPGHLEGVATVVLKLLNTVRPDRAYFGQKDAQQLQVVRRLARDLDTGAQIVGCPTVRESDGLAMSSRNLYLDGDERRAAAVLVRALRAANQAWLAGERGPESLEAVMARVLAEEPLAHPDYARVVDPQTFQAAGGDGQLAVLAVRVGGTRLIDNHVLGGPL